MHVYEVNKTNSTYSRTINVLGRAYSTTDGSYYHIGINNRAENMMPKQFVVTDAIIVKKKITIDDLPLEDKVSKNNTLILE